ncbi:alpha-amylase [Neptuniibacter sp.]|uniref:alpha-amylase n=1 Tax=Neptuniibacter sp. TaxID=1962643 RepID=UPI00260F57FA|nr:alpha-amylase [Neptuniibacter sp.]
MSRTSNDDRSDSMNPNNDAYWASLDNHSNQLNPNHEEYGGKSDNTQDPDQTET